MANNGPIPVSKQSVPEPYPVVVQSTRENPVYVAMSYRVLLSQLFVGGDGCAYLEREVRLPFAPFVGLRFEGFSICGVVESVTWEAVESGRFVCTLCESCDDLLPLCEMIEDQMADGWKKGDAR